METLEEGGLPAVVDSFVTNMPEDAVEIVGALVDHPDIRRINLTGSTKVGRIIAQRVAGSFKPVLLELGGKAPLLVLKDAGMDEVVKTSIFGAFFDQGQICISTERIIVVPDMAEAVVVEFTERARALKAGDPREGAAPLGTEVDARTVAKVEALSADAVAKGATVTSAGAVEGVLMPTQVVDRVTAGMSLYFEESFGPVAAVLRAMDEEDVIRLANDSEYGLSATVFSRGTARAVSVARRIRSGIRHVNGPTMHDKAQMSFAGTTASG